MASDSGRLYVGSTSDLALRVAQHRMGIYGGFTSRYRVAKLVHFEETANAYAAVSRERQIKGWLRRRKVALVEAHNPAWRDLAQDWPLPPRTGPPHRRAQDPSGAARPQDDSGGGASQRRPIV